MRCELCQRIVDETTRHHLIPRSRHTNKKVKRTYNFDVLKKTVDLCLPCHGHIHSVLTEKEMEREFNTIERLASYPEIFKFINWIKSKPPSFKIGHKDSR